jgi:hypothetical protein
MSTTQGQRARFALSVILTLVLIAGTAVFAPIPQARAASVATVANINITLRGDAGTAAYFSWHLTKQAANGAQPRCELLYWEDAPAGPSKINRVEATPTAGDSGYYFTAQATELTPGSHYNYSIRDAVSRVTHGPYRFSTPAPQDGSASFVAVPDMYYRTTAGNETHWGATLEAALARFPQSDFVVHTGEYLNTSDASHWDALFARVGSRLPTLPIIPATSLSDAANRLFINNFNVPTADPAKATEYNTGDYYVHYGDALLLVLNTAKSPTSTTAAQQHAAWVRTTVAEQGEGKWVIAVTGDSLYGGSSNSSAIKKELTRAFDDTGVSLVLQGEDKVYARSYLVKNNVYLNEYATENVFSRQDGTIYLTPGNGGGRNDDISSSAAWVQVTADYNDSASIQDPNLKTYSHVSVSADAIRVEAYTVGGLLIDSFEINSEPTPKAAPRTLEYDSLNNAFGNSAAEADPQTTRSISWKTSNKMVNPFVELRDAAGSVSVRDGVSAAAGTLFSGQSIHKVFIDGLEPGTTYEYRVGNRQTTAGGTTFEYLSDWFDFKTAPASEGDPYTFMVVADSQGSSSKYTEFWGNTLVQGTAMATERTGRDPAFILHTGDMVDANRASHWGGFLEATGTELASAAWMPALGNHEGTSSTTRKLVEGMFNVPSSNGYTLNYSVVYGNALILMMNSNYTAYGQTLNMQSQLAWASGEIEAKGEGKFIIVGFHKAPYGGAHVFDGDVTTIKTRWLPEFERLGVDLVLNGHDHNYIRTYPIKSGYATAAGTAAGAMGATYNTSEQGIVFQVSNHSGEKYYPAVYWRAEFAVRWDPGWNAALPASTTYALVTVDGDSIDVRSYTAGGTLIDEYTLTDNTSAE